MQAVSYVLSYACRVSSSIRPIFSEVLFSLGLFSSPPLNSCHLFLQNLPFRIDNRYRLTALFILFFGSGFAVPFVAVRHQMLKK